MQLPVMVEWTVKQSAIATKVELKIDSDAGRYLFYTPWADSLFSKQIARLQESAVRALE